MLVQIKTIGIGLIFLILFVSFIVSGLIINGLQLCLWITVKPISRWLYRKINYHLLSCLWNRKFQIYLYWWFNSSHSITFIINNPLNWFLIFQRGSLDYWLVWISYQCSYWCWNLVKTWNRKCPFNLESFKWVRLACCLGAGWPSQHSGCKYFFNFDTANLLWFKYLILVVFLRFLEFKTIHQESSWMDTNNRMGMEICGNWIFRKKLGKG